MPWIRAGWGDHPRAYHGADVLALAVPVAGLAAVVIVAAVVGLTRASDRMDVASAASTVLAACSGLLIVLLETVSMIIPDGLLPTTIRRATIHLSAGSGLWVCFFASATAAIAAAGSRSFVRRRLVDGRLSEFPRLTMFAIALLLVATSALGWLRYEPWVHASAAGQATGLEGSATPWIGPLSLFALWLLIGALAVALVTRGPLGPLVAAAAGWLVTFVAALTIVIGGALGHLRADDLPFHQLRSVDPSFGTSSAAWAAFAAGLAAATAAALLLTSRTREGIG